MNVLIIGSGAREHAIAKALSRSLSTPKLFCCGTARNPGILALTQDYWVGSISDPKPLLNQVLQWRIDLAIIGPEAPLEQGIADVLWDNGIPVVGPKKNLAQIESSKAFTRNLMHDYNIPGLPKYKIFASMHGIEDFLLELGADNYVVKANGLMAGKGVKVAGDHLHSISEALIYCQEIFDQGQKLVIEEKLIGQEFSFMCFSDGACLVPMPLVQDNKRAFDDDEGPNTGGMGSFSAADHSLPFLKQEDLDRAFKINQQVVQALMDKLQDKYIGILYGGFIATAKGVYVIEFNARFGDPEALNVLSILESDFLELCLSLVKGTLNIEQVQFANKATVCKYAVPEGYPDYPLTNVAIDINDILDPKYLYLAAVNLVGDTLYATGSRTAAYVGVANTRTEAEQIAELEINRIKGPLYHRKDIGTDSLINKRIDDMRRLRDL